MKSVRPNCVMEDVLSSSLFKEGGLVGNLCDGGLQGFVLKVS